MKFFLDHNVDTTCCEVLAAAGHSAWTTTQARRGSASDDDQTVYAMSKGAVLITHDREFTTRRKQEPYGHHVRLICREWAGPDMLRAALPRLIEFLKASPDMVVEISPGRSTDGPSIALFF